MTMISQELNTAKQMVQDITSSQDQEEYLSWRVCGFSITESLQRSGLDIETLAQWYIDSKDFFKSDRTGMYSLRTELVNQVLKHKAIKNSRSLLELDDKILQIALDQGISQLTENEAKYIERLRPAYDSNNGVISSTKN